jgi:glycosyltransferase involved in cell wall biosynthesis
MNVLITNIWLSHHGGTEVVVRDLAIALHKRGAHVEVYSPELGAVADEIRNAGILIVDSTEDLIMKPDLIHAQHFIPAMDAMIRFPDVPAIYFLHDRTHPADTPPKYSQVVKYMAVDYNCLDRLIIDNGIDEKLTGVLYNWVDTDRFRMRSAISEKPAKALVFSNYATKENYFKILREACSKLDIELEGIGIGFGNPIKDPENILHQYDIVFAKAKAAMEALATGAGVILCDTRGLGEFVSRENFNHFRKFNFGMKTLVRPINVDLVIKEILKYNPDEILEAAGLMRNDASFSVYVDNILKLYHAEINNYYQRRNENRNIDDILTIQKYLSLKNSSFQKELKNKQNLSISIQKHTDSINLKEKINKEQNDMIQCLSRQNIQLKSSWSYRIGRFLTAPARFVYEFFR